MIHTRILRSALPLLLGAAAAACNPGTGRTPPISASQAADSVMLALRDGDYARAHALLSTGAAGRAYAGAAELQASVEADSARPQTWTWGPEKREGRGDDYDPSYVVVEAPVTFADGGTGTARAELQALGMQSNPWRFRTFQLRRP